MQTVELSPGAPPADAAVAVEELLPIPTEAVDLLEQVLWGTEGAQYRLLEYGPTLNHLPDPHLLTLQKDRRLTGLLLDIAKPSAPGTGALSLGYQGLLAVRPEEQRHGYGKTLVIASRDRLCKKLDPKALVYCFIEQGNVRSQHLFESLGYQSVGKIFVTTFSRAFLKGSPRVTRLTDAQEPEILRGLERLYTDHALADFALSLRRDAYYVLTEGGDIVAGVQVEPQRWKIQQLLPGWGGWLALQVLPRLPILKEMFNPNDLRFLKIGNVFFRTGRAAAAYELLEGVLTQFQLKTAMLFWDKRSPVYREFSAAGSFGILNPLTETPVDVLGFFQGFHPAEIEALRAQPLVISPIDL